MQNFKSKRETRVAKVSKEAVRRQLNALFVAGQGTSGMLPKSHSSTCVNLDGVQKVRCAKTGLKRTWQHVPVIGVDRKPLMPTTPWRAERWIKSGKATPFWNKGIFCVRLNVSTGNEKQPIACGIDPGSKKEGFTVKSESHTFLNINADAVTWVKEAIEIRRIMRKTRRGRKTPCRSPRFNRARGSLMPSTKARWQWKLRLVNWLCKMYPIGYFIVEDIKAVSKKGQRKWNKSFAPLENGKNWFYEELSKFGRVELKQGWETKELRDSAGLKKTGRKLDNVFSAHCVDSWVLANHITGGHIKPDNENLLLITPLQIYRRKLHYLQPAKQGIRQPFGGTRSLGFKRGSIVKHPKYGITLVGGTSKNRISLRRISDGKRLCHHIKPKDLIFKSYNSWRTSVIKNINSFSEGL